MNSRKTTGCSTNTSLEVQPENNEIRQIIETITYTIFFSYKTSFIHHIKSCSCSTYTFTALCEKIFSQNSTSIYIRICEFLIPSSSNVFLIISTKSIYHLSPLFENEPVHPKSIQRLIHFCTHFKQHLCMHGPNTAKISSLLQSKVSFMIPTAFDDIFCSVLPS